MEKQYGVNSLVLVPVLTGEAQALRQLGHTEEAVQLERRLQSLQATATKPN